MEPGCIEYKENKDIDIASLKESIHRLLFEKEGRLKRFLQKDKVRKFIAANAWEIVPDLCMTFASETENYKLKLLQPIEETLLYLAETCPPKELLILYVEQLKERNDNLFQALLPPVQKCLFRIASKTGHSLSLVLKSFYDYIKRLPLPKDHNLEGKERLLLDLDENVQRITVLVPSFLDFISPFVSKQSWKLQGEQKLKDRSEKQIKDMTACLIQLLNYPFAFLDLSHDVTMISNPVAKSAIRISAETIFELLKELHPNQVKAISDVLDENGRVEASTRRQLVSNVDDSVDEMDVVPLVGLSTLAYFLFSEKLSIACIPLVYSHQFLFEFNCPFLLCLLQRSEFLVVQKGLTLAGAVLRFLVPNSWSLSFMEYSNLLELIKSLVYVASSIKSKEMAEYALQVLITLLKLFEPGGRVRLLHYLLMISPPGKVTGYIITMLMNEINEAVNKNISEFLGPNTEKLLLLVFALPKGEKTDLLDHSERIMGALNLLQSLLLLDGANQNMTGIWNLMPLIEDKYLQVLGAGIDLSRAHYKLELNKIRQMRMSDDRTELNVKQPQTLTKNEQIRVMQMAINTFDMMEGVLGKVSDLVQHKKKDALNENVGCVTEIEL